MNVLFRVDSSRAIGSGHVMRCIRIAQLLTKQNVNCIFVCRNLSGNSTSLISDKGFKVMMMSDDIENDNLKVNWRKDAMHTGQILENTEVRTLVVDHYNLDKKWEDYQRKFCKRIMVIDDLDNREHSADILLDQNLFPDMEKRYTNNLNSNCKKFIGLEYAFLDPEFVSQRKVLKKHKGVIETIFIYFGNTGSSNILRRVLNIFINNSLIDFDLNIIFSGDPSERDRIVRLVGKYSFMKLLDPQPNLAKLISSSDLSIGAGGSTTWERIYLGLPSIVITVADNQIECSEYLNSLGLIWLIGHQDEVSDKQIVKSIKEVIFERNLEKNSYECLSMPIGTKSELVIDQILQST
jgi:UDP-2,4-diacetamido-2,4,6-trideoxy-beta-L-altropyranose hydrolase